MTKYLVTYEATIGRTREEGAVIPSITLTYYSMVEAATVEAANDMVVVYRDPGFSTRVVSVAEVADILSASDLFALLNHEIIIKEGL
jgi:kynureninase